MKASVQLYHALPSFLWPILASARAYSLKRRRFGLIFKKAVPAIRARQGWAPEQWQSFQARQLGELMTRASTHVVAYHGNPAPADSSKALGALKQWPLINIDHFRANPSQYCDPEFSRNGITLFTSGSTGTPKRIIRDARAEQLNYAYAEARWRNGAGVSVDDRWAIIGGQLVTPAQRRRPPFWVAAYPTRQLYLSSYHLQRENARPYMEALHAWRPKYIWGYPSSMEALADFSEQTGIRIPLVSILSNAEPLMDAVRAKLERTFQCKVYDTYGCTEAVFQAFECTLGRMHVSPDFGVLEILREDGSECEPGEVGKVVATGLINRAMPLIRYPIGDLAAWSPRGCDCGCSFPVLEKIEGREDDVLILPDGKRIGRLDPIFKGSLPIKEAQIVQKVAGDIEIRIVAQDTGPNRWNAEHATALVAELQARTGKDVPILVRLVDRIPRGANGKFKAVIREKAP